MSVGLLDIIFLLIVSPFVLSGLFIIYVGVKQVIKAEKIRNTGTTEAREIDSGRVELKGTARRWEDAESPPSLETPIKRNESLVYEVEVESFVGGDGSNWETIYEEGGSVPFIVEDGTGKVIIDPPQSSECSFILPRDFEKKVRHDDPEGETGEIGRFIRQKDETTYVGYHDERRRYSEGYVEPGDDLYVLGKAREPTKGTPWGIRDYVISETTDSDEFIISDRPEKNLVRSKILIASLLVIFGLIFALFPVVVIWRSYPELFPL